MPLFTGRCLSKSVAVEPSLYNIITIMVSLKMRVVALFQIHNVICVYPNFLFICYLFMTKREMARYEIWQGT